METGSGIVDFEATLSGTKTSGNHLPRIIVIGILLIGIFLLFSFIIFPFLEPLTWALILTLMCWPLKRKFELHYGFSSGGSALLTCLIIAAGCIIAIFPLLVQLALEAQGAFQDSRQISWLEVQEKAQQIPVIGKYSTRYMNELGRLLEANSAVKIISQYKGYLISIAAGIASTATHFLFTLGLSVFFSFFFFRDGAVVARQIKTLAYHLSGKNSLRLLNTAVATVRATVYGTFFTAMAQGVLAGIGFWLFSGPMPVLLGFLTMMLSLIPIGAPLVYLPTAAYVGFIVGPWYYGLLIALWGVSIVSTADNIIRPLFIAQATDATLLLVFLGVVGGIINLGMVGLFVGPVVMVLAQSIWHLTLESIATAAENASSSGS